MKNPILQSYQSRLLYAGVWILITSIQTLVVCLTTQLPAGYAFADSLVFNALFAFYLIPLWYPVYYNRWKDKVWYINLLAHSILAIAWISVWLASGYLLMLIMLGDDPVYRHFLNISLLWKIIEGVLLYVVAVLVYYLYRYIGQLNEQASNEIYLNKLVKDSELNLLKSQINPHFLFNGLNSVNALIIKDPQQAQEMLVALSDYLRYTVLSIRQEVSHLQEEIENIERYLSIEKLRFGDKLNYEFHIAPDSLSIAIPSMLLQPLFENAIKHGVYESIGAVNITAKAHKESNYLCIEVSNDFDPENVGQRKGSGTGLKNISERLRLSYGTAASLQTKVLDGKYTAMLKIPIDYDVIKQK